jgi:pantoate--beta-alanine ligase
VVSQMARDLDLGVKVVGAKTVRERDGLAMSSRNVYLSAEERQVAPTLHATMKECAKRIRAGEELAAVMAAGGEAITKAGFVLDYLEARNAETLAPIGSLREGPIRMLVAAKIGATRLIDNIAV